MSRRLQRSDPVDADAPWRRPSPPSVGAVGDAVELDVAVGSVVLPRPRVPIVAILTTQGVIRDEHTAFASVLSALPDSRTVNVGHLVGRVGGAGGAVDVDAVFEDVDAAYIVAVPGGLGLDETTHDDRLLTWLRRTAPHARWVVSSSTGSVTLAAAGLLAGQTAATSWLATSHLARHGVERADDRTHVSDDRIITCTGSVTAFRGAMYIVEAELGRSAAEQLAAELAATDDAVPRPPRRKRWRRRRSGASTR